MRAAGFWAGAGKSAPTEGLYAHNGADHVAVDVDVARLHTLSRALAGLLNPAMNAESEAETGCVDLCYHLVKGLRTIADHMHDGAEYLAFQQ